MERSACGWRTIRSLAMKRVHERIREEERRLGRELSEKEFRSLLSKTLAEELRQAFIECRTGEGEEVTG